MAIHDESGSDTRTQAELLRDLNYGPPHLLKATLERLAAIGEAEALDAITEYLHSQPVEARVEGLESLRILAQKYMPGDRYMLAEVLMPFLESDEWKYRLIAAQLLNAYPNELVFDSMRKLVSEARDKVEDERRRRFSPARMIAERTLGESVMALASCGGLRALPDIMDLMDDPTLRPIATRALGVIGSETERDHLMEDLIEDPDVHVREAAHWALNLMDERQEMFMRPPDQQPEPPPDRLSPLYWMHRELYASDDDLYQFLVVRVAIEHLMLDPFLSEHRIPETCRITVRRYEGDEPPDFRQNRAEITGLWQYHREGPALEILDASTPRPGLMGIPPAQRGAHITISYPADLVHSGVGLVSFDCMFGPFLGRGWIYRVTQEHEGWTFALVQRTWAS